MNVDVLHMKEKIVDQTLICAKLLRFLDAPPGLQDAAMLVTLGAGADVLCERLTDYAQYLPTSNWARTLGRLSALPVTQEALIGRASHLPCIVAVSGPLAQDGIELASRLSCLGAHCTIILDATTKVRPDWHSVIRLPPHRSRDAQWAWCMRVYLDALLNRGLLDLDPNGVLACTASRHCELSVAHAQGPARAISGVERAIHSLEARLDLHLCDRFLLLFHSGPDIRPKEMQWGVQAFRNDLATRLNSPYLLKIGHVPANKFAVSLLAGRTPFS